MNNKVKEISFDFSDDEEEEVEEEQVNDNKQLEAILAPEPKTLDWMHFEPPEDQAEDEQADKTKKSSVVREPFEVVLVNIKKAAEERLIYCEHRLLGGPDSSMVDYMALSYRWGELDEQLVMATKDYNAKITSFQLDDFFKLCQAICHEPDLKGIDYVWVDAICVDQENQAKRKATIYRMNDIYIHAAAIIAVPDLHASHLAAATTANRDVMAILQRYRLYLYHVVVNTPEAHRTLTMMDDAWLKQHDQQRTDDAPGCFRPLFLKPNKQLAYYQQLLWQQQWQQRYTEIRQSMDFLQSLMEDWSNRTWVISEYHIAKRKSGKMKFWYNQLSCAELHGYRFFEFDFTQKTSTTQQQATTTTFSSLGNKFKVSMQRQLTKRTVLEMMLQTKATKSDDRFHAIIPLSPKYKHHIKDRHSVSTWGISNMVAVRLKLLEWMDTKDQLNLLYSAPPSPLQHGVPFLPTFATCLKTIRPGLLKWISQADDGQRNFDLANPHSVRLVRPPSSSDDDGLDELWLSPRYYYTMLSSSSSSSSSELVEENHLKPDKDHSLWHRIGLDQEETLAAVSIPLFLIDYAADEDEDINDPLSTMGMLKSDLQLVGSWKRNRWVAYRFCSTYKNGKIHPSRPCLMNQQDSSGFRIY